MRRNYFYLPIVVGLVDEKLLGAGWRSQTHGSRLRVVAGMMAVVLPCQSGLVPANQITNSWAVRTVSWTLPLWLESLDEAVHGDVDCVRSAVTPGSSLTELHPAWCGEVGALRTVVAGVEA